jgi:hypothetical protein
MDGIWRAALDGDLAEVVKMVEEDPAQLNAKDLVGHTPLMPASAGGRVNGGALAS